jgi:colanic acid biosynthesis glycosyl transferase WcaI
MQRRFNEVTNVRFLVNDFSGHPFQITLSRELARRGHDVLHLYFADNLSTPKGNTEAGKLGSGIFAIEGLHVAVKFSKHSIRTRRKADIAYGRAVAEKILSFKPEIVISANMPLDAQDIAQKAAVKQGAMFIFWLQDVYSLAIRFVLKRKLGSLSGLIGAYYERLERALLKKSDRVICISPEFAKIATNWGVEPSRVFTIENWAALDEVTPMGKDNEWARAHGVDRKFCFMYSGTLGMKHRPELLLALARYLETIDNACLIVVAGGTGADWLRENGQAVRKDVLTLLPFQPYNKISEVMGASDVLIALLDSEAGAFAVPSKVLSYLCAGRPLIVAAPRENHAVAVVESASAGVVISPDGPEELVNAAKSLIENAELRARYASNARAYAIETFDIARITDRFFEVFSGIAPSHLSKVAVRTAGIDG